MKRWLDFIFGVPLVWFLSLFQKKKESSGKPKKILVIKLAAVGDTILLAPVLSSLKKSQPQASIHWLVSTINKDLALTFPDIEKLWVLTNYQWSSLKSLVSQLKEQKYDVVIDLEQWARGTALISYFSGAPTRLGFDTPGQHRSNLFTDSYKKTYSDHEIYDFYNVIKLLGPVNQDTNLVLWETNSGKSEIEPYMKKKGELSVLFHPGCGKDGELREWPLENYALLGNWLMNHYGAEIYISGGPDEKDKTKGLEKLLAKKAKNFGALLSWQGTISLVQNMDLVISGNTGVMHMAAALKKKQVALHGPTNPVLWGPLNENAKVIQSSCPHCPSLMLGFEYKHASRSCMDSISLDEVKKAISALIDKG